MTNYLVDNLSIPGPKSNLVDIPIGADLNKYVGEDDWNAVRDAFEDVKAYLRGRVNVQLHGALGFFDVTITTTHATSTVNLVAHGRQTGQGPFRLTNSGGALPTGYASDVDYWWITVDADHGKLASSHSNALALLAVSITDDGTGTHTLVSFVDDTAAFTAAVTALGTTGSTIHIPSGNYLLTNQGGSVPKCVSIPSNTPHARFVAEGRAVIRFDSSISHCFRVNTGCQSVSFEGIEFQGYSGAGFDDFAVNAFASAYIFAGCRSITIERCRFIKCQAFFAASDDAQDNSTQRLLFQNNYAEDAPNTCAGGPSHAKIIVNTFVRTTPGIITQSHAIYGFGGAKYMLIAGNTFIGHGDATIEIRATTVQYQTKRNYIIDHNFFSDETQYSTFISTQASEADIGNVHFTNNISENAGGFFSIGLRDSKILGNTFMWDYRFRTTNANGISIIANFGGGSASVPANNIIGHNTFIARHPFWALATIASQPNDGDQIVVGNQTYTWRTSPLVAGDVARNANIDTCAKNLAYEIQGRGLTPCNVLLRDITDVWYSNTGTAQGKVWVSSYKLFTFTRTGTAVSVSAVSDTTVPDATGHVSNGIVLSNSSGCIIDANIFVGCAISASDNIDLSVKNNKYTPGPSGVGPVFQFNPFARYVNNETLFDRSLPTVQLLADDFCNTYDAWPSFENLHQPIDMSLFSANKTLPWLQSYAGWVRAGNGKARTFIYYGHECGVGYPEWRAFHWEDGDTVILFNGLTEIAYVFSFKRSAPNGTTEFNDYASLLALINTQTAGSWVATNPVVVFGGSDSIGCGYIEIEAADAGAVRNLDSISIVQNGTSRRGARTCGVYLRPWADGGIYHNSTDAQFGGGSDAVKAELTFVGHAAHANTVVRAKRPGAAANAVTVAITTGAADGAGVKTESGAAVTLQIKSGVTTVTQLEALIATCSLIEVKTPGTGATVLDGTDAFAPVALAGGTGGSTKTVIYSPHASKNTPLMCFGRDAVSDALNPRAFMLDTIPGQSWTVTHADASATIDPTIYYKAS